MFRIIASLIIANVCIFYSGDIICQVFFFGTELVCASGFLLKAPEVRVMKSDNKKPPLQREEENNHE
jgi:hypothetical protein